MPAIQKSHFVRGVFYISGVLLLSLGVAVTILANLGASPIDALLVGLYRNFGLTIGTWEYIISFILLLMNALINRRRPQILALLTAVLVGLGIDAWMHMLSGAGIFAHPTWNMVTFLAGAFFCSLGIATYLQAEFLPSPFDETMLALSRRFGLSLFWSKNLLMTMFLILAWLFQGPIAFGTLIFLISSGPVIAWFYPKLESLKIRTIQ